MLFDDGSVAVIAHRGASGHAPENTLEAFEQGLEMGAHGFELDVQLTADGHPVVVHDGTVDRTTNRTGPVGAYTLAEMHQLDAGHNFSTPENRYPFRGKKIYPPSLAEVLSTFRNTPIIVELKAESGPDLVPAVARVIEEQKAQNRVIVGSFSSEYLQYMRQLLPGVLTGFGKTELRTFTLLGLCHLSGWYKPPGDVLLPPEKVRGYPFVNRSFIRLAKRTRYPVHVWTVEEKPLMRKMITLGVDGIMTGYPDLLVEVLNESSPDNPLN